MNDYIADGHLSTCGRSGWRNMVFVCSLRPMITSRADCCRCLSPVRRSVLDARCRLIAVRCIPNADWWMPFVAYRVPCTMHQLPHAVLPNNARRVPCTGYQLPYGMYCMPVDLCYLPPYTNCNVYLVMGLN